MNPNISQGVIDAFDKLMKSTPLTKDIEYVWDIVNAKIIFTNGWGSLITKEQIEMVEYLLNVSYAQYYSSLYNGDTLCALSFVNDAEGLNDIGVSARQARRHKNAKWHESRYVRKRKNERWF